MGVALLTLHGALQEQRKQDGEGKFYKIKPPLATFRQGLSVKAPTCKVQVMCSFSIVKVIFRQGIVLEKERQLVRIPIFNKSTVL